MSDATAQALQLLAQQRELARFNAIDSYFPDEGPFRRELYPKHMQFFEAGSTYRERAFLAGNRVGKTLSGAYEVSCHLTGRYPKWWIGRRFDHPVVAWAAGDSSKSARDIVQLALYGLFHDHGTGMIPKDLIVGKTIKTGIADCIETIFVRHVSGGVSEIGIKSYDQQRDAFQGTNRHILWLDEEPPYDIYVECLLRTMVVNGLVLMTATPLLGMTEVVRAFIQPADGDISKFFTQATWDDVPHLDASVKSALLASIPPYQREARSKGVPQLGSGAIYPIAEEEIVVSNFEIPAHWPRAFGLDVGWKRTAGVWGARNNDTGEIFLYSEYYGGHAQPAIHADGIRSRGKWIPGVIDPSAQGRSQADGTQLIQLYRDQGLELAPAVNAVETGLYQVWQLLSSGKLKVFRSLGNWLSEFRLYQRDAEGRVVKQNDHLMDATRYLIMSGRERLRTEPLKRPEIREQQFWSSESQNLGWMV